MTVFLARLGIGGWAQILMIARQDPMSLKKVKALCNWEEVVECLMRICLTGQPKAVALVTVPLVPSCPPILAPHFR